MGVKKREKEEDCWKRFSKWILVLTQLKRKLPIQKEFNLIINIPSKVIT